MSYYSKRRQEDRLASVLKGIILFLIVLVVVLLVIPFKPKPPAPVSQTIPETLGPTRTPRILPTFTLTPTFAYMVISPGITVTLTPAPTATLAPIEVVAEPGSDIPPEVELSSPPNSEPIVEINDPLDLINNPGRYRNKLLRIAMYVNKVVLTPLESGGKSMTLSLVTSTARSGARYRPVLILGLLYDPVNRVREGDLLSIDGVGLGSLSRSNLETMFEGELILPRSMYSSQDNWSIPAIRGNSYSIIQR